MAAMLSTNSRRRDEEGAARGRAQPAMDGAPLDKRESAYLLGVARTTVQGYLERGQRPEIRPQDVPSARMVEERACFVTIYRDGRLRGCIGSLEAQRPLVLDVIENALSSAFEDPRFQPVCKDELPDLRFSISVLGEPRMVVPDGPGDLLEKLVPGRHGLIIQKGANRATFLPAVWEVFDEREEFLSHLCLKAGLRPDEWKETASMKFHFYEAQEFGE